MLRRKSSRYEATHRALLDRSRNLPPETSPQDLKTQTLDYATMFLHAQIQEAQEYTEQLRCCLSDRTTQLKEHQGYQRERWRTDRRLAALRVLMESARVECQTVPKFSEIETTSLNARKQANLSSFFQRAARKAPLRFNCVVAGKAIERRVLKQVSPLVLKPSIPPNRILSLSVPEYLPPLYARRRQSEKMINTVSTREGLWLSSSSSYSITEGTSSSMSPKTLPDDNIGTMNGGIAVILSHTLRPEEEIIAEMGDIVLPAYALNLLEDLDDIHDKIPLRPESQFNGSSPPHFVTPSDWDYPPRDPPIVSPRRTATLRIPDRHLADALLSSPETESAPRKRGHAHKVSLDPASFKEDSKPGKPGEVASKRLSIREPAAEEGRKPKGLLKRKSSAMFSIVSRNTDRRGETSPSTPRKNITSLVKKRMSSINRFR